MKAVVLAGLAGLGGRRPPAGIRAAGALATATRSLGFGVDEESLAALFPDLDAAALTAARHAT